MKLTILRALAVIVAFGMSAHAAEVRTAAFKIDLPGEFPAFDKKSDAQTTVDGTITTNTWISKSPVTAEAIIVSESTMPGKILDTEKLFDKTRDALLAALKGTVEVDEQAISTIAERRLRFRTPGAFIRARLAATGDRLFQLLYVARSSERREAPLVSDLFSSFQVLAEPALSASAAPSHP